MSRSRHHRKAARVLPLPVGAQMRVCSPPAMAGQPRDWAAVGDSNDDRNQSRARLDEAAARARGVLERYEVRPDAAADDRWQTAPAVRHLPDADRGRPRTHPKRHHRRLFILRGP